MITYLKKLAAAVFLLSFCSGCSLFLPAGDPPGGPIVDNRGPEKLSREEMILSLGSRIAASSMEHFPNAPIAVEAPREAAVIARSAISEAANICGVRFEQVAAAVLNGRQVSENIFEFELFHFSRSLWRCTYILKKR